MTKQELIEQTAFEAYPENKGHSILFEKVIDYNSFNREPYQAGLEKGWQMAIVKAYEWLNENTVLSEKWIIEDFRKAMEG